MVLRCPHWVTRRTTVLLRNQKAKRRADFPGKASGLGHAGMLLVRRVISWKGVARGFEMKILPLEPGISFPRHPRGFVHV